MKNADNKQVLLSLYTDSSQSWTATCFHSRNVKLCRVFRPNMNNDGKPSAVFLENKVQNSYQLINLKILFFKCFGETLLESYRFVSQSNSDKKV